MTSTDLIRTNPDAQVRSFHRAFTGELTIYHLGNDISLWRPIPARGVFWAAALEITVLALTKITGVNFSLFSIGWGFAYFLFPFGLAWLLTVAKIEGRRIHVTLTAWVKCFIGSQRTVGGVRPVQAESRLHSTRIRVQSSCAYVPLRPIIRYAISAVPIVCLLAVLMIVLTNRRSSPATTARPVAAASVTVVPSPLASLTTVSLKLAPLTFLFATTSPSPKIAPRKPAPVHVRHRAVRRHAARFSSVPRRKRAAVPPHHAVTRRRVASPVSVARTRVVVPVYAAPRVQATLPAYHANPIPSRPSRAPACYPGELGC